MSSTCTRILAISGLAGALLAAGWACGPEFPSTLIGATDGSLTAAPTGDFAVELLRIAPGLGPSLSARPQLDSENTELRNVYADANDLSSALMMQGVSDPQRQALVQELLDWRRGKLQGPVPTGLPEEFAAYDRGAVRYRAKDMEGARKEWTQLLALPETQRQWRTIWASYMIARSYLDTDPARAATLFAETRALAAKGFNDSLGLIAASKGWEARARLELGQPNAATALYLEQGQAGDPMARWNLADTASQVLAGDDKTRLAAARDLTTRQLVTAYLLSYPGNGSDVSAKQWMDTLTAAGITETRAADRLAWAAYQANDVAAADRWLKLGGAEGESTAVGQWIRAKLALRAGNIDAAATALANAAAAFPRNEEWNADAEGNYGDLPWRPGNHAAGELALLKLGRAQFVDAMDLFFRNGFWADAAFIAERVLTVDELKRHVDQTFSQEEHSANVDEPFGPRVQSLRYLLARRLTRLGQWKVARPYYPVELRPVLDQYIAAIRDGHDAGRSAAQRAASLWDAAKLARFQGMELLGTEVAPDEAIFSGNFQVLEVNNAARLKQAAEPAVRKLSPVTAEEQRRLALAAETIDKRWHYRYIALDHAWAAAQLMPSETDELAQLLNEAGQWVAGYDPQAADRFYKALVTRCGKTPLGKEADRLRWFPPL